MCNSIYYFLIIDCVVTFGAMSQKVDTNNYDNVEKLLYGGLFLVLLADGWSIDHLYRFQLRLPRSSHTQKANHRREEVGMDFTLRVLKTLASCHTCEKKIRKRFRSS
jgi:hypothetical protein